MMNKKTRLRKNIVKKRNLFSPVELLEKSNQIKKRIIEMEFFGNAKIILFYVSYGNEVYTHDLIKDSMAMGKIVVVPKSVIINNTLLLSKLTSWNDLEIGAYNILEPKQEAIKKMSPEAIDLIFVPGVAFDVYGNRIGHGKGYYDRLLQETKKIPHIGLAFELQIVDIIPTERHDLPVDFIVTEKRIIRCQSLNRRNI